MNVAPHSVSGRVVKTTISSSDSVRKVTSAPSDRPIQLACMARIGSGQSRPSNDSNSSAYFVIEKNHCSISFWTTG